MKMLGYSLIILSFLGTSLTAVLHPLSVNWLQFSLFLVAGIVGLTLIKHNKHKESRQSGKLDGHINTMEQCLQKIVSNLQTLNEQRMTLPTYEVRFDIDRLFRKDLNTFADIRKSMLPVFGMQQYADIMSAFAAGERYINRIWSASTDGYEDEVRDYILRAYTQFKEANEIFSNTKIAAATK